MAEQEDGMKMFPAGSIPPQQYKADQASHMNIRHEDSLYKFLLNTQDLISEFEHTLRGDSWVTDRVKLDDGSIIYPSRWEKAEKNRAGMSDEAIREIVNIVRMYVNKITVLSNIPEKRIMEFVGELRIELIVWILFNGERLGIPKSYRRLLITMIVRFVEMGLRKSQDGGERNAMMIASSQRTQIMTQEQKKKGVLRKLF